MTLPQDMTDEQVDRRMIAIRSHLIMKTETAFFGVLAYRVALIPDETVGSECINGRELRYARDFVRGLTWEEAVGVFVHELMHPSMGHLERLGGRDFEMFNVACDHAINLILLDGGFTLPEDRLADERFRAMSAEEIYSVLMRERKERKSNPQSDGSGKSGGSGGTGAPSSPSAGNQSKPPAGKDGDSGEGDKPKNVGGCGVFDVPKDDQGKPATRREIEEEAREWQIAVNQAVAAAKRAGELPGYLETIVGELREPVVSWREQLKRFVSSSVKQDYTWSPPNRRHVAAGMYLPGIKSDGVGEMVFAIDTSGSMDEEALQQALDELNGIIEDVQPETVHVIQCDTRINHYEAVSASDYPLTLNAKGRGGTNFVPVFDEVARLGIAPICLVYFTDLCCNWFPDAPDYPVLWAKQPGSGASTPPFGEVIHVTKDGT
jgi:predicted metal-dependent peptidase